MSINKGLKMTNKEQFIETARHAYRMLDVCENENALEFWGRMYSDYTKAQTDMFNGVSKLKDIRDELLEKNLLRNSIKTSECKDWESEDFNEFFEAMKTHHTDLVQDLDWLKERGEEGNSEEVLDEISTLLETVQFQHVSVNQYRHENNLSW